MSTRAVVGYDFGQGLEFITLVHDGYPSRVIPILEHIIKRDGVDKTVKTLITDTLRGWWYLRPEQDPDEAIPEGEPVAELVAGFGGRLDNTVVGEHYNLSYIMGKQQWIEFVYEITEWGDVVCSALDYPPHALKPKVTRLGV